MVKKNDFHGEEEFAPERDDAPHNDMEIGDFEELNADKIKRIREKLKACDEEKRATLEELQRVKADFLNSKRRLEDQFLRDKARITHKHILELLPLADSFEMAMSSPDWKNIDEVWRKGIEGVYANLQSIFKNEQVTTIDAVDVPFNPHEHEAISNIPVTDASKADTVVHVLQKGYRVGEDVIRPAKVTVGTV